MILYKNGNHIVKTSTEDCELTLMEKYHTYFTTGDSASSSRHQLGISC